MNGEPRRVLLRTAAHRPGQPPPRENEAILKGGSIIGGLHVSEAIRYCNTLQQGRGSAAGGSRKSALRTLASQDHVKQVRSESALLVQHVQHRLGVLGVELHVEPAGSAVEVTVPLPWLWAHDLAPIGVTVVRHDTELLEGHDEFPDAVRRAWRNIDVACDEGVRRQPFR